MMRINNHPTLKRTGLLIFLLILMLLSACVRQIAPEASPTPRSTNLLEELLTATLIPIETEPPSTEQTPTETLEPAPAESNTPGPTNTLHILNPDAEFTGAKHVDSMDQPALWYDASGVLPDTEYLKMEIAEGVMAVTGKLRLWDTWWISGFTLNDFYIEMEVNSGDCNPDDAYGMILRASQHGEPTHGYLIAFTCDGKVFAKRMETVNPYSAISILNPTETDLIYAGKNQTNIIGVQMEGNAITIYPNRRLFTTIQDDAFSFGRYGIFVQAGDAGNFTYSVTEIRTWGVKD
jgi:hypothetical protein